MSGWACALALLLALATRQPAFALQVVSDGTWKCASAESPGWQEPDFNDSSWQAVECPYSQVDDNMRQRWGHGASASPIWTPRHDPVALLRKTFDLPGGAGGKATAYICADDNYDLFVNGKQVATTGGALHFPADSHDIGKLLRAGTNVIAVRARDLSGKRGVLFLLDVTPKSEADVAEALRQERLAHWAVGGAAVLLGLSVLAFMLVLARRWTWGRAVASAVPAFFRRVSGCLRWTGSATAGPVYRGAAWVLNRRFVPMALLLLALGLATAGQYLMSEAWLRPDYPQPVGPAYLLFAVALVPLGIYVLGRRGRSEALWPDDEPRPVSRRVEWLAVAGILAVALLMRVWQITRVPGGLYYDEAWSGILAQRILEQGFIGLYDLDGVGREMMLHYILAPFVAVAGPHELTLRAVGILFGTATVGVFYLMTREMIGIRGALVAAFLFAVARWHVLFSRWLVPAVPLVFFECLTLYLLLVAVRRRKILYYLLTGLMLGLCQHTYMASRLFPLVVLGFVVVLAVRRRGYLRGHWKGLIALFLVSAVVVAPLAYIAVKHKGQYLARADEVSVFASRNRPQGKDVWTVARSEFVSHLMMFNYMGDSFVRHNVPRAPQLDPVMGVLLVCGAGLCVWSVLQPNGFLLIFWALVMVVPASLSVPAPHGLRALAAAPAVVAMVALALSQVGREIRQAFGGAGRYAMPIVLAGVLAVVFALNYQMYFRVYAQIRELPGAFCWHDAFYAHQVRRALDSGYEVITPPVEIDISGGGTFQFLDPGVKRSPVNLPDLLPIRKQSDRDLFFIFPAYSRQAVGVLKFYHPQGKVEDLKMLVPSRPGDAREFERWQGSGDWQPEPACAAFTLRKEFTGSALGLKAKYYDTAKGGEPAVVRIEPTLNLDWAQAPPPVAGPLKAEWQGSIYLPQHGRRLFSVLADGRVTVRLGTRTLFDGTEIAAGETVERTVDLSRGVHSLFVRYESERPGRFALLWAFPGGQLVPVPGDSLFSVDVGDQGLLGRYHSNPKWLGDPMVIQRDPAVYPNEPFGGPCSVVWTGRLLIEQAGDYTLATVSDDGASLKIDDRMVVADLGPHAETQTEATVTLTAGLHPIEVRWTDTGGNRIIELLWRPPGTKDLVPVPNDLLRMPPE